MDEKDIPCYIRLEFFPTVAVDCRMDNSSLVEKVDGNFTTCSSEVSSSSEKSTNGFEILVIVMLSFSIMILLVIFYMIFSKY